MTERRRRVFFGFRVFGILFLRETPSCDKGLPRTLSLYNELLQTWCVDNRINLLRIEEV